MNLPKRRGIALTIIGPLLMIIVAPTIAIIGIWRGVTDGLDTVSDQPTIAAGSSYQVDNTESRTVLVSGSYSASSLPDCTITGSSGNQVTFDQRSTATSYSWGDESYTVAGEFTPTQTGNYTINCGTSIKVLDSGLADSIGRKLFLPIGIGLGVGGLAFIVGVVLLIVGIVKLVNSGKERTLARQAAVGGYPGQYGGYGGYGGYQQQPYDGRPQPPTKSDPNDPYAR